MYKKILITLSAVCTAVTMTFGGAAITSENAGVMAAEKKVNAVTEVQTAIKTVKTDKDNVKLYNDMTADEFLKAVAEILPEGSTVTLSFDKETDYRIWNASSEKDGSIFANILFTCDTYTQHEIYDFISHFFLSIKSGKAAGVRVLLVLGGIVMLGFGISLSVVCFSSNLCGSNLSSLLLPR